MMNNKLTNLCMFAAGAVIGSAVTWELTRKHFEKLADEEIESMREYYLERAEKEKPQDAEPEKEEAKDEVHFKVTRTRPGVNEYAKQLDSLGYVDYSNGANAAPTKKDKEVDGPYVIRPDEFDELDYHIVSLTYYADRVLADEDDNVIEDVEDTVGVDALETFGRFEEDSVYVRDDRRKIDYEILADARDYADVVKSNPHLAEDE